MQQLNWKYKKKNKKHSHIDFPSSCGMIPKEMKAKPFHALLLIMCLTSNYDNTVKNAFVPFSQVRKVYIPMLLVMHGHCF